MDNPATTTTDDAELARVLESMNENAATATPPAPAASPTDETAVPPMPSAVPDMTSDTPVLPAVDTSMPSEQPTVMPPTTAPTSLATPGVLSPELESIKKDAVEELRPLVDKLDLPADEKFDTLLLIIRSTDDKALIGPAHEAAKAITDETKRAQALLDVIKEIDYFSNPSGQQ